jgi:hypothetical protein
MANDTCTLTGTLRRLPAPRDRRLEIFLQKKREDESFHAYQRARTALLAAIESDSTAVGTGEAEKLPTPPPRSPRSGAYRRRNG